MTNPSRSIDLLCQLQEECTSICREMKESLSSERSALIQLKWEDLLLANSQKEDALNRLQAAKAKLQTFTVQQWNAQTAPAIEAAIPSEFLLRWRQVRAKWIQAWTETRDLCEANQRLFLHSQKNLGTLVENLKTLLGQKVTYSAKGMKVEMTGAGKVVEASY